MLIFEMLNRTVSGALPIVNCTLTFNFSKSEVKNLTNQMLERNFNLALKNFYKHQPMCAQSELKKNA